jgi:hypothetical protein
MARKNDEIVVQVDRVEQQTRPGPHVHPTLAVSLPQDQITADLQERGHTAIGGYCAARGSTLHHDADAHAVATARTAWYVNENES